ncbi:hypothetical protein CVD28_04445 [Bacillus sp. M6-12]|uniref:hypothetical protein n=1 Tax=Bacillus sp. M6-12 TaxID=2054166 RepID=UPI000C779E65|nr:hypothetical protein [Bacillus sp. M6-12]PLS19671.1 hypothetical protein CVD28_04445 [Bacillus sp. M6-12]
MKSFLNKYKRGLVFLIFSLILLLPIKSFAHDTYFLQVLIDDHKYQYMGTIVEEDIIKESSHIETQIGKFSGLDQKVHPYKGSKEDDYTKYEGDKKLSNDTMLFTFSPVEIKKWYGAASNHANKYDANMAYKAQENLMAGLNDALRIANGGKQFTSTEELMKMGNTLVTTMNDAGGSGTASFKNNDGDKFTVNVGVKKSGPPQEGFIEKDYMYLEDSEGNRYEFIYRSKKGYISTGEAGSEKVELSKDVKDKYAKDSSYLTWNQLMYQANYAFVVKGYTLKNGQELVKPNPVEEAIVGLFSSMFNQLRVLLGLYEINDLVFNEGIRGSSAWTHGIMSKQWSDQAIAYHWLFQALAWTIITFAIVKNLVQRNFATINPAMRISLMESIQNLLITGFLLANAVPVMNMLMFLNAKLVDVFGATAPNFSDLSGMNAYSGMIGGVLLQIFYLGVSIYLNFVYIMRAITVAILIATAPLFIVTIAFGGKWKQLFSTWLRELVGNIYLQSFHAFMLSFFFSVATSSRGIESAIVTLALIPMTEFFRSLVMGSGGGIAHSMGMQSMSQAGSLVGGALSKVSGNKKNTGSTKTDGGGSGRETSSSGGDTGMNNYSGNSDKIKNNSATMTQRQRINSTKEALQKREMPVHVAENKNHPDRARYGADKDLQTKPGFNIRGKAEDVQQAYSKGKEFLDKNPVVNAGRAVAGAGQAMVGLGVGLAMGMENPKIAQDAFKSAQAGKDMAVTGGKNLVNSLPESTKAYATTLPNGDMQIHRSAKAMADEGVVGATMEGTKQNPIAKYTYDVAKLDKGEWKNLQSVYGAYQANNTEAINHYKAQGIESIVKRGDNQLVVRYNQTGMDKMGIKSVQTLASAGGKARIVETKASDAPNTLRTIPVQRYQPSTTSNTNGNTNGNTNTN